MFNDVGKKIKQIAMWSFVLEAIGSIITGIGIMIDGDFEDTVLVGLGIAVGGFFAAWLIAVFIYAFGELVDKTCDIERNTRGKKPQTKKQEEPKIDYYEPSGKVKVIAKDDTFIDLICPHCGKQVSFARDTKSASCPWCDTNINLQ